MLSRRSFLKLSAGVSTSLLLTTWAGGVRRLIAVPIPGGTLNPTDIAKFVTPVLIPPAMPRVGKFTGAGGTEIDYYEIAVRQIQQQILPAGMPSTTVWGYGPKLKQGTGIFNAPSLTIEARHNRPVRVKWINELVDESGDFLPHLLPVDPTLHWANPLGGIAGRDTRPEFQETPGRYTGPVPIVTHVHGAQRVGDESDGYAEAWYLPAAQNIPAGYASEGTWYQFFRSKALLNGRRAPGQGAWTPGSAVFQYPNSQRASTLWYHDHTLGMTRLNVYAGPAGFFIVRGGPEGDDAVLDSRTSTKAVLPGPAPALGDLPGLTYYEIPLAIQDRSFNLDGSLFYPDSRVFFDGIPGPYIPDSDVAPIWNPEFFGNCMMVNGATWPYLTVEKRRYRLRFLNGCNSRFLILDFGQIPNVSVWQIGSDGGFIAAPVNHTAGGNRILLGPAERADVIVDFTSVPVGDYVLRNVGPDEPFGGGEPPEDFEAADPQSTGLVMQFRVVQALSPDTTTPPQFLTLPAFVPLPAPSVTRPLALIEMMSMHPGFDGPAEAMLGTAAGGVPEHRMWSDAITENPSVDTVEQWELFNTTADAHPMHIHETLFQVINRQDLATVEENEEEVVVVPMSTVGTPRPPLPSEQGWKDTVISYPGEVTRVRLRFGERGQFVWHCHIVEHEDNEMMRPYAIGAPQNPAVPPVGVIPPEEPYEEVDDSIRQVYLPFVREE